MLARFELSRLKKSRIPFDAISLFLLLNIGIGIAGWLFSSAYARTVRNSYLVQLNAVADQKLHLVSTWRAERLQDAWLLFQKSMISQAAKDLLQHPDDQKKRSDFALFLDSLLRAEDYTAAYVITADGKEALSIPESRFRLTTKEIGIVRGAMDSRAPVLLDPFRNEDRIIRIFVVTPVLDEANDSIIGSIILAANPRETLYALLEGWPIPSRTAESLIVRQKDGQVVFLSELRHRKDSALMSIVTTEGSSLVSYKAIHGLQGPTEGTDYRGVPVQAVIRWVSGSNWYLIVKIDEEEIANATWSVSRYVLVLMLSVALLLSGWIVQRWYRQSARFVAERDRLRSRLLKAQELESVALLAGGVAHDFNNMLAGISGFAEVLQKGLPDGSLRGAAEKILDSTRRGAYVVQGLLAFSRQQRLREETIALNRLVLERRGDLEKMMGPTIEFRVDLSADEIVVRGDSDHLGQILTILAENSKEAMSGGGLFTIRTEARTLKEEILSTHGTKVSGPHACIVVSDTGKGMDEATQKRIFEPFFTTKEFGRNAGLGLAAVYGMMRQHDGFIDVKSAPSRGTTMTLLLPLTGGV